MTEQKKFVYQDSWINEKQIKKYLSLSSRRKSLLVVDFFVAFSRAHRVRGSFNLDFHTLGTPRKSWKSCRLEAFWWCWRVNVVKSKWIPSMFFYSHIHSISSAFIRLWCGPTWTILVNASKSPHLRANKVLSSSHWGSSQAHVSA